ncbi:phage terminase large subunit [Aminobacter niigataensis]
MRQIRQERARRAAEAERERVARDAERIRARCQTLSGFVREAWHVVEPNSTFVHGWHLDAISDHLEAVTDGRINRLLINVPPGTMKSLLTSVLWPAWEWGPVARPSLRYLTTSYAEKYVKRDSRRMRDLVQSEWYRALWPEVELVRAGEASFANTKTGNREGVPFASLTGGRGDRVIIDDPHSTETAESEAERINTSRIFRESVPTRLNDPIRSAIVVIMQRLHEDDVSGQIKKLALGYEHLMLPMEFEPDRKCFTSIGFEDPRTEDGELLFPERFPREVVERDKVPMGSYAVAGQFQQRPAPRSGGMFQRGDFEIVDAVPAGAVRCRAWDFAATQQKAGKQPDWTVGLRMAWVGGVFYVEDVKRDRWSPADVERNLKNTASQDGLPVRIRMPEDPGAAGKADAATKIKLLAGYDVIAVRPTGEKSVRAKPASAQAEAGNVKLVRGPWNETFLDEVCSFPNAQHDDQVDAFADALNELALAPKPATAIFGTYANG